MDFSLRDFSVDQAPAFMPMFDAFPYGVCRADLVRYTLLKHFKGIYADLDCQCLQSKEPLLNGAQPRDRYGARRISSAEEYSGSRAKSDCVPIVHRLRAESSCFAGCSITTLLL